MNKLNDRADIIIQDCYDLKSFITSWGHGTVTKEDIQKQYGISPLDLVKKIMRLCKIMEGLKVSGLNNNIEYLELKGVIKEVTMLDAYLETAKKRGNNNVSS